MAFDDLAEDNDDSNPGDEALDELAGTLSGESTTSQKSTGTDSETEPVYNPETEPAFPSVKQRTQHSVYCLPQTWDAIDGSSGLLFEAEITLRRNGYGSVQKRELHNALLQAALEELTPEDVAESFIETRETRLDGPLLEDGS